MATNDPQRQAREKLRLQREHERYINQQQREAERVQRHAEREQREQHISQQREEAVRPTEKVRERTENLSDLLRNSMGHRGLTFDRMRLSTRRAPFQPGPLGQGAPAPRWEAFAPRPPGGQQLDRRRSRCCMRERRATRSVTR